MKKAPNSLDQIDHFAQNALRLWDIGGDVRVTRINVSENVTYRVDMEDGRKSILRVHREGYHSEESIQSELNWLNALQRDTDISLAKTIAGNNGRDIQSFVNDGLTRNLVMFEFLKGETPSETGDLTKGFHNLGGIAAACHKHVSSWQKPVGFTRHSWDEVSVFGLNPTWGNWRDAPNLSTGNQKLLEHVEIKISNRLTKYGKNSDRFGLIHGDMRLANLLVDGAQIHLIDFDDCGFGWLMYDFAAAISFIEDDPNVQTWKTAWLEGYRSIRNLSEEDEAEIETFIMLRRMALLAWIGSHIDAPEPQALAPNFATNTAKLGVAFLDA